MKKQSKKESFKNLSIKTSVAKRFRKFTKELGLRQSASLDLMLDFFETNRLSPTQHLGPNMKSLEHHLEKRINASIAIVRAIENTQTKPTQAMLAALFESLPEKAKKKLPPSFEQALQNTLAHKPITPQLPQSPPEKEDLKEVLKNIELVKPTFGNHYLKVNMEYDELKSLKYKYHVYHD
ncbi:BfmA/BtgA family mobilization protein [uncultured Salegentibacter sp.]|uniref:BfmA/BtgA family mobilization protein n=1 Tax=uncultured Salegentibacter sp. TaxID=259320 RepID=UPI0030DD6221